MSCDSFDPETNRLIGRCQNSTKKDHLESLYRVRDWCQKYEVPQKCFFKRKVEFVIFASRLFAKVTHLFAKKFFIYENELNGFSYATCTLSVISNKTQNFYSYNTTYRTTLQYTLDAIMNPPQPPTPLFFWGGGPVNSDLKNRKRGLNKCSYM